MYHHRQTIKHTIRTHDSQLASLCNFALVLYLFYTFFIFEAFSEMMKANSTFIYITQLNFVKHIRQLLKVLESAS